MVLPLPSVLPLRRLIADIRADYGQVARYRAKYHGQSLPRWRLPVDLVQKIGFQMAVAVRVMQFCRRLGLPLAPQVVSRLIRHLYASEIHWDADIRPGLSIIHGTGLIITHAAKVSEGCILFQNVTLGEGICPVSRKIGAPELGVDVHVGPGATLIGPIHIGRGSKIMAGSVLAESVPEGSLVAPAAPVVQARGAAKARPAAPDPHAEPEGAT